jgi:hypothetical protein
MKNIFENNKRAQITIFVIIAILVVAIVALLLFRQTKTQTISAIDNPSGYLEKCVSDAADKALGTMTDNTGIGDKKGVKIYRYNGTNVAYLCYTGEYNVLCNNEHPMLNKEIENEILNSITLGTEDCFTSLSKELSKYSYSEEKTSVKWISVSILPKKILIELDKKISYIKNEAKYNIEGFKLEVSSSLFDFISLSSKIVEEEMNCDCQTESCNADTLALSLKNTGFEISKPVYDFTKGKIYIIKDNLNGNKFQFAIRNCAHEVTT